MCEWIGPTDLEAAALTLGLLRGLVESPDDAPLIDRDLDGHNKENIPQRTWTSNSPEHQPPQAQA